MPFEVRLEVRYDLGVENIDEQHPVVDAEHDGEWQPPLVGAVTAPAAVLIRPDGYVAWVGDARQEGLAEALSTWVAAG